MIPKEKTVNKLTDTNIPMSNTEYNKLSCLLMDATGIKLPPAKKTMVMARLIKRLHYLNIKNFNTYYNYLLTQKGQAEELKHAISAISTNKTEFFREESQFNILSNKILPSLINTDQHNMQKIKVWSAGCSSGEEPYSIAMSMDNFLNKNSNIGYSITATDISCNILTKAQDSLYCEKDIVKIPTNFKKKYLLRGQNSYKGLYCIKQQLKKNITFKLHNLITDPFDRFGLMDIIFCRNVIIYFEKENQNKIFQNFYKTLQPGGYLFIGASETLFQLRDYFKIIGPNIYKKI